MVFHVVATDTEIPLRRGLSERNIDFLIARRVGPFQMSGFDFEALYDDLFVVVAGAKNPWARRRRIGLAELVNESWVLPPPESVIGSVAVETFRASGLDYPRVTVVTVPREVRMSLVATGRFLTILPKSALRFSSGRPEIKVLPVKLPISRGPIGIVTLKNRTLSPVARLFIDAAREVGEAAGKEKSVRKPWL